jgi:hypothetical protein
LTINPPADADERAILENRLLEYESAKERVWMGFARDAELQAALLAARLCGLIPGLPDHIRK